MKPLLTLTLALFLQPVIAQHLAKPQLLKNIQHLPLPDTPRLTFTLLTFSDTVENIAIANIDADLPVKMTIIATAPLGKGKIIAFGAGAYLHKDMLRDTSVHQFTQHLLTWAANGCKHSRMGVYPAADSSFLALAHEQHIGTYAVKNGSIEKQTDIIYLETDVTDKAALTALESFVRNGGTLIQVSPGEQLFGKAPPGTMQKLGINTLLVKAGLYDMNMAFFRTENNKELIIDSVAAYLRLSGMLPLLKRASTGVLDDITNLYVMQPMLELLFENNDIHSRALTALKAQYKIPDTLAIPTPKNPVSFSSAEEKTGYRLTQRFQEKLHPTAGNKNAVAPGARYFPGLVPDTATRVIATITVPVQVGAQGLAEPDAVYFRPHATGLYVPPGTVVKVIVPGQYKSQHLVAQIGVHSDDLSSLDRISRSAENMVRTFPLDNDTTEIYSPFGGLLELNIGDTSTLKTISITVAGAVKAPYFKLGATSEADWNNTIRNNPSPWAELATDKIILTVPAYRIRQLSNPVKLMQFYDEVMDADADLTKITHHRPHPERIIVDQDVAYGYMYTVPEHIIVPDDQSCEWMLNEAFMREHGSWGLFHELGHRHQFYGIDFSEVGEVTVNLFTMHVYDKVLHKGLYNHDDIASKETVLKKINNYLQHEPSFEKFGQDPFLALSMYIELLQQFGWQCIDDTYTQYRAIPASQYPQSQEDKRDLWFLTICNATKTNLTSFFDTWKVPVSDKVKAKVTAYPSWLPDELKNYDTTKTTAAGR